MHEHISYPSRKCNIPLDMDEDILLPGRLKLPQTKPALEPDFYLNLTKRHHKTPAKSKEVYPFNLTLDWKAKLIFAKLVKRILDLIHDGPNSTILLVELLEPFDQDTVVRECIVKIYKPSFEQRLHSKNPHTSRWLYSQNRCKIEFGILRSMQSAGIRVPTVYACHKHILFMSTLESFQNHLQYVTASKDEEAKIYHQIVDMMTLLYRKAKMVQTNVSKMNTVLDDKLNCWFLDVSSTIDRSQPGALDALMMDCRKIEQVC